MIADNTDRSIRVLTATPDQRAAINRLVARQMAAAIRADNIDPDDSSAVMATLLAAGHTDKAVGHLAYLAAVLAAARP